MKSNSRTIVCGGWVSVHPLTLRKAQSTRASKFDPRTLSRKCSRKCPRECTRRCPRKCPRRLRLFPCKMHQRIPTKTPTRVLTGIFWCSWEISSAYENVKTGPPQKKTAPMPRPPNASPKRTKQLQHPGPNTPAAGHPNEEPIHPPPPKKHTRTRTHSHTLNTPQAQKSKISALWTS